MTGRGMHVREGGRGGDIQGLDKSQCCWGPHRNAAVTVRLDGQIWG